MNKVIGQNYTKLFKGMVFSEKSFRMLKEGFITIMLDKKADKSSVKDLCIEVFGISPVSVNICNAKPKRKVFKGVRGVRSGYKKAFVKVDKKDLEKIKEMGE